MPYESVVLDVLPKTFIRANTYVSRASWNAFQRRYPEKTFEEFGSFVVNINRYIAIRFASL
jgi:hypothetical protein